MWILHVGAAVPFSFISLHKYDDVCTGRLFGMEEKNRVGWVGHRSCIMHIDERRGAGITPYRRVKHILVLPIQAWNLHVVLYLRCMMAKGGAYLSRSFMLAL